MRDSFSSVSLAAMAPGNGANASKTISVMPMMRNRKVTTFDGAPEHRLATMVGYTKEELEKCYEKERMHFNKALKFENNIL